MTLNHSPPKPPKSPKARKGRRLKVGTVTSSRPDDWAALLGALDVQPVYLTSSDLGRLPALDAFVLGGGCDIHPWHYGQGPDGTRHTHIGRDALELTLFDRLRGTLPILGVCRGAQLINVACGGTLVQDMAQHWGTEHAPTHTLEATPELAHVLPTLTVNSSHHQAIDELGAGVEVLAYAPDAVPEAWRIAGEPTLGVQFHPETLARQDKRWLALFHWWLQSYPVPAAAQAVG